MGIFLDKFENWFLNYSRRTVSLLVLVALLTMTIYLVMGVSNTFDSVNNEKTDSFSMPEFEKPISAKNEVKEATAADTNNDDDQSIQHPMPEYEDEIAEIVEDLIPLYIAFKGWDSKAGPDSLTNWIVGRMEYYEELLSEEQMENMVDGLVDYVDEFSDFYTEKFSVDTRNLEKIVEQKDKDLENLLDRPTDAYGDGVLRNLDNLHDLVDEETQEVSENNMSGMGQLMIAVSIIGGIVLLLLILLIFKAENSLRRSADTSEKE
jgi:hypothetical protein|tara:strand:- start:339 stop:1127 length:789 start_codon:yes stop_codon:yes gene_type:complete